MTFAERMQLLSELGADFSTEVTPTNYSVARKEFLENTALIAPRFEYKNARSHVEEYELIRHAATIFRTYGANDAAQEMNLRDYAICAQKKIDLLNDLREYRSATTRCERVQARDRIVGLAQDVFGVPEEKTFRGILRKELANVLERGLSPAEEQALLALADQVGFTLGDLRREPEGIMLTVDPELVGRFRGLCELKWHEILTHHPLNACDERVLTAEEVCRLVNEIILLLPEMKEFRAVVSRDKTCLSVNTKRYLIEIPENRANGPFTLSTVRYTVLAHELLTHAMRQAYAKVHRPEVSVPLNGYIDFDEGVAKAAERSLRGEVSLTGREHYISIGLAYFEHKSFREVFEFWRTLKYLSEIKESDTEAERARKIQAAEIHAFKLAERCFRGTGEIPLLKDLTYYNGQVKVWRYIEALIDEPEKLWRNLFEAGKTDPTNPLHQELLKTVGWRDADFGPQME